MTKRWQVLIELVKAHGWQAGAEIGVLAGKTTTELLANCQQVHLIAVDPLTPQPLPPESFSDGGQTYRSHNWLAYQQDMVKLSAKYKARLRWLRMLSAEAAPLVENGSLDFVFIDANHATKAVQEDIRLWTPKLRASGWLTGHDTHFPSVLAAINQTVPGWKQHHDNVWSIPKAEVQL